MTIEDLQDAWNNLSHLKKVYKIINEAEKLDSYITVCNNDFLIVENTKFYDQLAEIGIDLNDVEWGYSDETLQCKNCGDHVDTQPSYNGDIPDYVIFNDEVICGDCLRSNDDWIEEYVETLVNNSRNASSVLHEDNIENLGFEICNVSFEAGLHEHANDNPEVILEKAREQKPGKEFVFQIISMEQFGIGFTIWSRNKRDD